MSASCLVHDLVADDGAAAPAERTYRVLYLNHTARMGGGEIALINMVRFVNARRYHPVVVLFSDGPLAEELRGGGVETHILPLDASVLDARKDVLGARTLLRLGVILRSLKQVAALKRFIRKQQIDLVHANSLKADLIGGLAARWAGVPVMWHVRDRIEEDYLPRSVVRVFRFLARWIPSFVVAPSDATLKTVRLKDSTRTATIYSGIDPGLPATPKPAFGSAPLIGLVGRITRWKGQDVFLRAAVLVLKRFPEARFQIIGAALFEEQEFDREVRALAAALGIEKSVEFTGFRKDVLDLITQLDLLVHASTTGEPFGQVIVEGMAAEKAVVATNGGGVPEIVIDGQTGLLVPMGDASAMADAICRILADPALASRMGEFGRQRVIERFTVQRTASDVERVYARLLGTGQ